LSPGDGVVPLGRNARLKAMLAETLISGMDRGEVRADIDVNTFVDLLLAAYVWNYRHAPQGGADTATLIGIMDGQIGVLFDGVAAR